MTAEMPLAQQRAERDGLTQVLVIPFELLRIATGHPMILSTADGEEVLLRLMTAEELVERVRAANGPPITMQQAVDQTRPLVFPASQD